MIDVTKAEFLVLNDLYGAAQKAMRSKPTLRTLSKLMAKGLIEYDPLAGTVKHTEAGLSALSAYQ